MKNLILLTQLIVFFVALSYRAYAQPAGALDFDGFDDYVELGNTGNNLQAITISAWIYRTGNTGSGFDEIWSKNHINTFSIQNSNDRLYVNFGDGTAWGTAVQSTATIPLNQWVHVAATRSSTGQIKLYVNGVLNGTGVNNLTGSNTDDRAIGRMIGVTMANSMFEGAIDELRVFDRELQACEIVAYMNCELTLPQTGLVNYYKFNQGTIGSNNGTETTLLDETGNTNGTLNNFTLDNSNSNFVAGNVSGTCTNITLPTASFTINQANQCLNGNNYDFSNTSTAGSASITTYAWDVASANFNTVNVDDYVFATSGSKTITLTITDANGCTSTTTSNVTVYANPPKPAFSINDNKQCFNGHHINLTDNINISFDKTWIITNAIDNSVVYNNNAAASNNFSLSNITLSTHGSYAVKFTVTDANNCSNDSVQMLYIYPEPTSSFIVNDAEQCLSGNVFNFTNQSTIDSGAVTYAWAFGDFTSSSAANPTKTYLNHGNYNVRLIVSSVHGQCRDTSYLLVSVYPQPAVNFGITNQLLCSREIDFADSSTIAYGSITGWNWNFGDLTTSNVQHPQKEYATGGSKTITLTVTSDQNCTATATKTYNLINAPIAQMGVNQAIQCLQNNSFIFNNLSQSVHPSWITGSKWFFGNGDTSNNRFPNPYSYNLTGTYTVKLVVYSTTGCTDTTEMNVTVNGSNAANFSVVNPTCSQTLSFINSQPTGTFLWNFGDGNTSTAVNPTHTYATPGTYNVKLVSYGGGCPDDSITIPVGVGIYPNADFNFVAGTACNEKVVFTNTSTISSGTMSYLWDFGDATTSTETNPQKSYTVGGSYTVTLTATSSAGCISSTSKTVVANSNVGGLNAAFTWALGTGSCLTRINFTNQSTGATHYIWQFHDGFSSSEVNPHKTYATTGTFWVRLIAFDGNGCADTTINYVTINSASGNAIKASFTVNSPVQCLGSANFNFFNNSYDVGWGWGGTYSWDFGDGTTSNNTFIYNKQYTAPGIYTVSLFAVANSNGCRDTAQMVVIVLPTPNANFTVTNGCGNNVAFTNTSTGATSYSWQFGDGNTSTLTNPIHNYTSAGWYFVTLTATAPNGCSSTYTTSVVPSGNVSLPVASFTHTTNTCNNAITFTSNSSPNLYWDFGDGNTATGSPVTHSYATSGTYNVTLIAGIGLCSDTIIVPVSALASTTAPVASFNILHTGCDDDILINNTSTDGTDYKIYVNGNLVYNGLTPNNYTIANATAGTYHISVVASAGISCKDSVYQSYTIWPVPDALFTYTSAVCGGTITFNNTSTNATSYYWDFGDATTSVIQNPSKNYATPGTYNVMLVAFNQNGCSDTVYANVNAVSGAALPVASFTHSNETVTCTNKINFTNTSTGTGLSYLWDFGDGNTSTQKDPKKGYAYVGTYTVTLTVTNASGCSATATSQVTVPAGNGPSASFYTDRQVQCITNNNFNFYNNSIYMGTSFPGWINSYQWDFGDGSPVNTNTFIFGKVYSAPGNYTVRLVATSTDGCRDTMTLVVKVQPVPCTGGTISNNNQGEIGSRYNPADALPLTGSTTGINNKLYTSDEIRLYPNPNAGNFTLSLNKEFKGKAVVNIIDMVGKNVYTTTEIPVNGEINLTDLPFGNGQYLITIHTEDNELIGYKKFTLAR